MGVGKKSVVLICPFKLRHTLKIEINYFFA